MVGWDQVGDNCHDVKPPQTIKTQAPNVLQDESATLYLLEVSSCQICITAAGIVADYSFRA